MCFCFFHAFSCVSSYPPGCPTLKPQLWAPSGEGGDRKPGAALGPRPPQLILRVMTGKLNFWVSFTKNTKKHMAAHVWGYLWLLHCYQVALPEKNLTLSSKLRVPARTGPVGTQHWQHGTILQILHGFRTSQNDVSSSSSSSSSSAWWIWRGFYNPPF